MYKSGMTELEAVLAVARHHGFRPAATELGMSTSALSNAVAGLEARLGVRLFHRTTRSVALTEAGRQFVARVGPALSDIRDAMDAVDDQRQTPVGTLRINTSAGAARMIFAPLVLPFLQRYPGMTVEIVTEGQLIDVVGAGFDAGIRLSELVPRDMIRVPIGADLRMAVVGAPGYLARHSAPVSPADLASHQCIRARFPSGLPSPWEFARAGQAVSVAVPGALVLDDPSVMLEAARAGVGLAFLVAPSVADDVASGRLVRVLEDWTPPFPGLALYYAPGRHVPAGLRAFIELIREVRAPAPDGPAQTVRPENRRTP